MTRTPEKNACDHNQVVRMADALVWNCTKCAERFQPEVRGHREAARLRKALDTARQEATDANARADAVEPIVDTIAGTMAAVLWDFHERAVGKYGPEVAETVSPTPKPGHDYPEDHEPDEPCETHDFYAGKCRNCDTSIYLGTAGV